MTILINQNLARIILEADKKYESTGVYTDFHTRGLYGEVCFALISPEEKDLDSLINDIDFYVKCRCFKEDREQWQALLASKRKVNKGYRAVYYFKGFNLPPVH